MPAAETDLTPDEILFELTAAEDDIPDDLLWAAYDERDALRAPLLESLAEYVRACVGGEEEGARLIGLPWAAMYLLAQFREERAFALLETLCRLPPEAVDEDLFDVMAHDLGSLLASTCGAQAGPLRALAEDPEVRDDARFAVLGGLMTLVANGAWTREAMVDWLRDYWPRARDRAHPGGYLAPAHAIATLGARELMPLVWTAVEGGRLDLSKEQLSALERQCGWGDERRRVHLAAVYRYVEDPAAFMSMATRFADDEDSGPEERGEPFVRTQAKVGRNDPCPCGSGKKYKKCCLGRELGEEAF